MIYSQQYKTIFVHNQKTGGSSIEQYFEEHVPDARVILPRHTYVTQGMGRLGPDWEGNYVFGFVRNPWARLVSWYSMVAERPEEGKKNPLFASVRENASSFEEFLRNCTGTVEEKIKGVVYQKSFVKNQLDYFTDAEGKVRASCIGRFEHLEEDFQKILEASGLPKFSLELTNSTSKKEYRTFYTNETRQLVANRFAKDIEYFEYEF